jgi:hypothetical protein
MKSPSEIIQAEAEKVYELDNPRKNMFHDNMGQYSRREAFTSGAEFMLKHAIGFSEWVEDRKYRQAVGKVGKWVYQDYPQELTTSQLFQAYLNEQIQ